MANKYRNARKDFEHLEDITPFKSWDVVSGRIIEIMRQPVTGFAARLYIHAIQLWFEENHEQVDWHDQRMVDLYDKYVVKERREPMTLGDRRDFRHAHGITFGKE